MSGTEERVRFVVRRLHKLTGQSYIAGVRDTRKEAVELAQAERSAGGPHVRATVSLHPSPEPLEVFE